VAFELAFQTADGMLMEPIRYANGHVQYNMHNLYGNGMARLLRQTLIDVDGKRPLVLARAAFPGFGAQAGHWCVMTRTFCQHSLGPGCTGN
jgi:alpha-glucosidase (family GH31 glycosyl hydrolase)